MTQAIFLSYASQDADAARRICEAPRDAGLEVWFDQSELRGGDAWDASIRQQIKECALFVPIISANTDARPEGYFRLEWKLAVDRSYLMADNKAFLFPVILGDVAEATALVPDKFRERQWTRITDATPLAAFVERASQLISPAAPSARAAPSATPVAAATAAVAPDTAQPARRRGFILGAVALVTVIAVAAVVMLNSRSSNATIDSVAVLPFENGTGDAAVDYLSDGISESLINKLSGLAGLRVISRTSAFSFKGKKMNPMEIG